MTENSHLPNEERVMQVGLWETDPKEVKKFADRVAKFNDRRMSNIVLDVEPNEKAKRFDLRLTFPNHAVQDAFWLE